MWLALYMAPMACLLVGVCISRLLESRENYFTLHPALKCIEITFMARIDVLVHLCEGQVLDLESSSEWVLVPL